MSECVELLEETFDVLNDIWQADLYGKDPYSQERMAHLFTCIGSALTRYVQDTMGALDIWTGPFTDVRASLGAARNLCEKWTQTTSELTSTFWQGDERRWGGGSFQDDFLRATVARLEEVTRLRTTHEELVRLLSRAEQQEHKVTDPFRQFLGLRPLCYNPYTQERWEAAVAQYESRLQPIESHIGSNLRRLVSSGAMSDRPLVLLRQFQKYQHLLSRPQIARALASERETLLAQLIEHLTQLHVDFSRMGGGENSGQEPPSGRNLSPRINRIIWGQQLRTRVSGVLTTASSLLSDLASFESFQNDSEVLQKRADRMVKDEVKAWEEEVQDAIRDDELSDKMTGKLMDIDSSGRMVVNYSERLVQLLREVRQLTEMGFTVHDKISAVAQEGEKFYRYGVMLKKVCNYFNTMESQIIPEQKAMLLDSLLRFEEVVNDPTNSGGKSGSNKGGKTISWNSPKECEGYVDRLQGAADRVSSENRKLRKAHARMGQDVVAIMNVDLLRSKDKWKARWQDMKGRMEAVCQRYPPKLTARWTLHWDHQVYKALEASYRYGLESLNEMQSEIKCELVFSNRQLQFRPPLEELRAAYYREMKKFIAMPNNFGGLAANAAVYQRMAERNVSSMVQVYTKAEDLFTRLVDLRDSLADWMVLGMVPDLDAYVEENVTEVSAWDANFKALKVKRKEAEKIADFSKVDCVNVSTAPFKSVLEDHMQRFGDALTLSLRKSVMVNIKMIEQYLEAAEEKLSTRPQSIAEIGEAKVEWKAIDAKKAEVKKEWTECEEKKRLLVAVAGTNTSIDVSEAMARLAKLPSRWENFEIAMEAFNEMIEEARERLKSQMDGQVEECNKDLEKMQQRWHTLKPTEVESWEAEVVEKVFKSLEEWQEQFGEIRTQAETLTEHCKSFGMNVPHFEGLNALETDMQVVGESWGRLKSFLEELEVLLKTDWITFRSGMYQLSDLAQKWKDELKGMELGMVELHISDECNKLNKCVPALKFCRGDPFKEEHWTQLFHKLDMARGLRLESLTLGDFLRGKSADNLCTKEMVSFAKNLTARAQGEVTIREALQELRGWTETCELKLYEHSEAGRVTFLITEWKDLFLELGDNQSLLGSLKESQYFKPFADQAQAYADKMTLLDTALHAMNQIQRKWVYLEPIFGRGALPSEQARFRRIDNDFRDIMGRLKQDAKLFGLADESFFPGLLGSLETMLDQLERCQKALADFLEQKREKMPRFYFLGDDDLLEILGQSKNAKVIQSHLKKLYQGVHAVQFSSDASQIVGMASVAGEDPQLTSSVAVTEFVEEWLTDFTAQMKETLRSLIVSAVADEPPPPSPSSANDQGGDQKDFGVLLYPSQVLCIAEQVKFTVNCEKALKKNGLADLSVQLTALLKQYTSIDLSTEPLMQLKVKALVLDLVHSMDVVTQLQQHQCSNTEDWIWQKQLRYGMEDGKEVRVLMSDANFAYTYEYQGNAGKLVHTPLTDKCFLTLTQGMHMGFGGNPYGPAGTGKTESVKALGAAFGRQVLVFNCDEGIDFQSMGRIFIGLVKCGAWGCFDEFNRLKEDQLSAISQQIQTIQDAIKTKTRNVELLGRSVDVDFDAGIFVTLNPPGKKYGGRSKLPDNLKALFRPVSMGRPDNNLIAEVMLYSEGFAEAKELGSKIVSLFLLSNELLSPQQHYDWGLRALKAVLNTGGKLITSAKREKGNTLTLEFEAELLIKAVRINTLSKLTFSDSRKFIALIGDVFTGIESSDIAGGDLEVAIREVMAAPPFNLVVDETQIRKMLQLKESLDQRMGCVIVGPSGSGKTALWRVLQAALIKSGKKIITHVMNPKSMPRQLLLGHMDLDTREWSDGVLTDAARKVVKEPLEVGSWIVCDGDVDPEWVESLNSVLDDNHLLTLPNGERISFGSNVNFLFETHDLRFASPATISRMGMIFLSDEDVDVKRLVKCWLDNQPEDSRASKQTWINELFYRALDYVLKQDFVVDTTMVGTVLNGLSHVQTVSHKGEFVSGLIRGLGGNLGMEARSTFAKELYNWSGERPTDMNNPLDCWCDDRGSFVGYETRRETYGKEEGELNRTDLEGGAVIPTISVQRTLDLVKPWVDKMDPFLLVGPEGSGKNMIIRHAFKQLKSCSVCTLHCNAQTAAEHVIQKIQQSCALFSTNTGRVYRPRESERLVLYLKDINLPKPDKYDTCMLVAFLQQLITFNGFYDEQLEFLGLERVQIVCSMNPSTTVGRHGLSTRFTAISRIAYMDYPETSELEAVYSIFLEAFVNSVPGIEPAWQNSGKRDQLSQCMIEVYSNVTEKFSVDEQRHYLFTPRDLTQWVLGLLNYDCEEEMLLDVVAYEANRLFRDRLVDQEAQSRFDSFFAGIMRSRWQHDVGKLRDVVFSTAGGEKTKLLRMQVDDFKTAVEHGLHLYEREEKELNMLLFRETLDHIAHCDRVLSQPGGSLLLVGRNGVGRRNAATLCGHMLGMPLFTANVTRDYSVKNFCVDLKVVLAKAGVEGDPCLMYLEDYQLDSQVLETINSLLSSGEVPGLYTHEELEPMLAPLKEIMMEEDVDFRTPYDFFVSRVQKNLHVLLAMDPTNKDVSESVRRRKRTPHPRPCRWRDCARKREGDRERAGVRVCA
jgi:dynein heavy chain 2